MLCIRQPSYSPNAIDSTDAPSRADDSSLTAADTGTTAFLTELLSDDMDRSFSSSSNSAYQMFLMTAVLIWIHCHTSYKLAYLTVASPCDQP
jgi:hypothetical protein